MSTGNRIRTAREQAGLTQRQLADKLGMPFQNISQWERGVRNPKQATLEKLAEALGISASELLSKETPDCNNGGKIEPAVICAETGPGTSGQYIQYELPLPNGRKITIQVPLYDTRLWTAWDKLNSDGQRVALERLAELAQIPAYQRPQEQTDTDETNRELLTLDTGPFIEGELGTPCIMERISGYITAARESAHLTQQTLGKMCGISTEDVMQYESGKVFKMAPAILRRICDVLKLDIKDVLGMTNDDRDLMDVYSKYAELKMDGDWTAKIDRLICRIVRQGFIYDKYLMIAAHLP